MRRQAVTYLQHVFGFDHELAYDCYNEAFLSLYCKYPQYSLATVPRVLFFQLLRTIAVRTLICCDVPQPARLLNPRSCSLLERLLALPVLEREVLFLLYGLEFSFDEVASVVKKPVPEVKRIEEQAYKRLLQP